MPLITEITIFVLAAFVGFEVISKVPTTLHTPLMSQTNAIHGIVLLGGLIVVGLSDFWLDNLIGTIAIFFGTINIVGGFMVTDRMLGMFVRKPKPPAASPTSEPQASGRPAERAAGAGGSDEGRGSAAPGDASPDGK
jgi:NAD(P) transhydrogenase subunit alpha